MTLSAPLEHVRSALRAATERAAEPPGALTILFSGGLDSSLLAWMLRHRPGTTLLTVGRPDSPDPEFARAAAEAIGLPCTVRYLHEDELREEWTRFPAPFARAREPTRSVLFGLAVALSAASPVRTLIGQGADELFGGYARFDGLSPEEAGRAADEAGRRLLQSDWPATLELAAARGVALGAPYLDPALRAAVERLPLEQRFAPGERKSALRAIARAEGVPEALAARAKKALQYGTRIAGFVGDETRRGGGP
jgi:asparagine synthase (glutamine-hydrolysing)